MAELLRAALGRYPHTAALFDGRVSSSLLRLELSDMPVISRAFAPMVREARYDVSEMAITTFVQARAYGKPLVLLPVVMAARFQEAALLTRAVGGVSGPADLAGRRVGVRAYGQTTAMWLRGVLADHCDLRTVRWVTFEDAHVPEYRDPASCERALPGSDMLAMLRAGTLDAAIVGNDVPDDPALRTVFADPAAAGRAFLDRHGFVPINHMVVVTRDLAGRPDVVAELMRMLNEAAALSQPSWPGLTRPSPPPPHDRAGLPGNTSLSMTERLRGPLSLALRYCADQGLVPHPLTLDELWSGSPC